MSEIDLLCECISTEGETEGGGVKFVYMDENTIYRFENNRMKKISKQLINKAKREITKRQKLSQINNDEAEDADEEPKPKKSKKTTKATKPKPKPIVINDSEDEEPVNNDEDEEDVEPIEPVKQSRKKKVSQSTKRQVMSDKPTSPSIDLDEYYSNKHKMEYMVNEINRLNGKIGKLKQYKSIVNKLTGGEIDDLPTSADYDTQSQQMSKNNGRSIRSPNDSLFMY